VALVMVVAAAAACRELGSVMGLPRAVEATAKAAVVAVAAEVAVGSDTAPASRRGALCAAGHEYSVLRRLRSS
jgi:hypothetical protein